jgi:hypothetical protein
MSNWEQKAAILEVLNGYSGAAGRLDIEAFTRFFTEDAEIHGIAALLGQPEPIAGCAAIGAFFGASFQRLEWLVQTNTTTDIDLAPDGASATTSTGLVEMAKRKDADMLVLIARYDDELTLTADGWRFKKRTLTPLRFSQVP